MNNLYGGFDNISAETQEFVKKAIQNKSFIEGYEKQKESEQSIKERLINFEDNYPNKVAEDNIDDIIGKLE